MAPTIRAARCLRSSRHAEGRVTIGHEQERICLHANRPAADADDEVEQRFRVAAGQENGEPGDDGGEKGEDAQASLNRRLLVFGLKLGLITAEEIDSSDELSFSYLQGIGRQVVIRLAEEEYEKNGQKKKTVRIPFGGIYSLFDPEVKDVPMDRESLVSGGFDPDAF